MIHVSSVNTGSDLKSAFTDTLLHLHARDTCSIRSNYMYASYACAVALRGRCFHPLMDYFSKMKLRLLYQRKPLSPSNSLVL